MRFLIPGGGKKKSKSCDTSKYSSLRFTIDTRFEYLVERTGYFFYAYEIRCKNVKNLIPFLGTSFNVHLWWRMIINVYRVRSDVLHDRYTVQEFIWIH